ncbi:hypothetical protein GQ53DRAFT_873096 [Thozetella sp. PMI_491]|nr:hypothetical protein GQ53DRAFT_873096 [Thozetella sp. PMI_491]
MENMFTCKAPKCSRTFTNELELLGHWKDEFSRGKGHHYCEKCMTVFGSKDTWSYHRKALHPEKQSISCPGCQRVFDRVGAWIGHIERKGCHNISIARLKALRESQKDGLGGPGGFGAGTQERGNEPSPGRQFDPSSADFNPMNYWCAIISKFKCPYENCWKSFPTVGSFKGHLKSPAHTKARQVQCPHCNHWFDNLASLVQHAESYGKCKLKTTTEFRLFVRLATGGLIDVDLEDPNSDGTVKYFISADAYGTLGLQQPAETTIKGIEI